MEKLYGFLRSSKSKKECSSSSSYSPLFCNCKLDDCVLSPLKGPPKSIRDAPPAHYILKICSFSALKKEYNSAVFDAGGYKWNLCLYPKGKKHIKGEKEQISLYLVMADSNSLALGWEVMASFRFSVFHQISGKYLTAEVHEKRFNEIKKEWGIDKFIPLGTFMKCSNGYLVDDECVFGVEVFDVQDKRTRRGECLSMNKGFVRYTYIWKIQRFSQLGTECSSPADTFLVGDYKWKIILFREGKGNAKGNNISLYLEMTNPRDHPPGCKVNVYCCFRVKDQIHGTNRTHSGSEWFSDSKRSWGVQNFMPLSEFNNPEKGFLVKDTCIVEVEVAILGETNPFS